MNEFASQWASPGDGTGDAPARLQAGEERFRRLAENAPDMIYRYLPLPVPGFDYVSPAALELTGYPPDQFYADPQLIFRLSHPDDLAQLQRILVEGAAAAQIEVRMRHLQGHQVWTEHRIVPVRDEAGRVIALDGIARDVSARKRAEDEVRLLQAATIAVSGSGDVHSALFVVLLEVCRATGWAFGQAWVPSPDGLVLLCGPAWCQEPDRVEPFRRRCLSFRAHRGTGLLGLAWQSRRPIWVRDVTVENFPRAQVAHEVGFKGAMAIPVLGGDEVVAVVEFYLFEPREEDERLVGVVSAVATQLGAAILRKRMEEELKAAVLFRERMMAELERQNQQLQALIQHMGEGVVAVDEAGRLLLVNPAATSLLGLPGPFDWQSIALAGFPPPLIEAIDGACQPGQEGLRTTQFTVGASEIRALISPMRREPGGSMGAVALLQDVTQEDRLRRLRENFVANVSHELRGPLAALSAGVEAMHDGLIPADTRPRYLKAMLAEIGRLRRLTDSLLELSRIDAGMLTIAVEPFPLAPLCERLAETWQPRVAGAGINLAVDCPPVLVLGSADRVEEVLSNFLDNALRHTPRGGGIRLFATEVGEMVRVGVTDTGAGIDRAHLPHIWDRFYKTDAARTRAPDRGTGLGLSICRQLVQLMGGEVAVTSQVGEGSTFSFTLVRASAGAPDSAV